MKPTIGRIVIYKVNPEFDDHCNRVTELPAIITRVWTDDCVNLSVVNDAGEDFKRTSQCLSFGQWAWPERQA